MDLSSMSEMEKNQLAVTLSAIILNDDKTDINEDNINQILNAANIKVPNYLPMIFSGALAGKNLTDLCCSSNTAAVAAAPVAAENKAKDSKPKKEEKKPAEEEIDFDMDDMFG